MTLQPSFIRNSIGLFGAQVFAALSSTDWTNPLNGFMREYTTAMGCHPGGKRERNEDRVAIASISSAGRDPLTIAILCDGVGGSEMGDTAATLAIAAFIGTMAIPSDTRPLGMRVVQSIRRTDEFVRVGCRGRGATTLSVAVVSKGGEMVAANIGDSRIFSWEKDANRFEQVSIDDTLENEIRGLPMLDESVLQAKGLRGQLSQAIGEAGRSADDLRIRTYGLERFDTGIVLASDGAWKGGEAGLGRFSSRLGSV